MVETPNFEDSSFEEFQWRQKEPESFKEIVLRAISKAVTELSKDLRKGGNYMTSTPKGIMPLYFPDQREVIINSIKTLRDLMDFHFDEEAKEKIGQIEFEISNSYDKFYQVYLEKEWVSSLREIAKKTGAIQRDMENPKDRMRSTVAENIEEEMKFYVINLYRTMFRELVLLFKRENEFSGKRTASVY